MSIIPIYETTFTNEQDKYNPDSLNNICTRLSVVQKLKNSNNELLSVEETQKYMESTRQKTSICILLDRSGSMEGEPLENSKKVINYFIQNILSSEDYFSLITFNSSASVLIEKMKVGGNIEYILTNVAMIEADGTTNIPDAIELGIRNTRDVPEGYSKNIILFTDGLNTVGPKGHNEIKDYLNSQNSSWVNTHINCCGFGNSVDLDTLNMLTRETDSKITIIDNSVDIIPDFIDMFLNLIYEISNEVLLRFEHPDELPKNLLRSELKEVYNTRNVQKYKLSKTIIGEIKNLCLCFENVKPDYFQNLKINLEIHDVRNKSYENHYINFSPNFQYADSYDINFEITMDLLEIEYNKLMKIYNQNNDRKVLKKFLTKCKSMNIPVDNPRYKELISNLKKFDSSSLNPYDRARLSIYSSPQRLSSRSYDYALNPQAAALQSPLQNMSQQINSQITE
jgi:Mg-chelatase subunit ChlD